VAEGSFEATEVTISAETSGKIIDFDVEEGDVVELNSKIALIDTVQLSLQKAQLLCGQVATLASRPDIAAQQEALKQQIKNSIVERDRISRLLADGAATQKQLDNANQHIATLESQLNGLSSQLNTQTNTLNKQVETTGAQIAQINDMIRRSLVLSPISGTVLTKYAEAGEITAPGKPLLKMADLNKIYLRAYLTSAQLADIKLGDKVKVQANYGGGNTQDYEGVIQWISSQNEFTPKTIQTDDSRANLVYAVKIAVKNDGKLKIGLQGRVIL
ncbi:MAG: HlyD family efflux transporter periplasmic adaptor subunit, partial [Muribaculaceae bacterium]|nr:HlyD family efflux transporter periplasmic adaptor subunit [Muribaculaceae bacterium]